MNISAMTLDEVRDKLAYLSDKYVCLPRESYCHPIPNTIDEATKLPKVNGHQLTVMVRIYDDGSCRATAYYTDGVAFHPPKYEGEGPTELEARFRLRLACELAEKEAP